MLGSSLRVHDTVGEGAGRAREAGEIKRARWAVGLGPRREGFPKDPGRERAVGDLGSPRHNLRRPKVPLTEVGGITPQGEPQKTDMNGPGESAPGSRREVPGPRTHVGASAASRLQ